MNKKLSVILAALFMPILSSAEIVSVATQNLPSVRVEGNAAFLYLETPFDSTVSNCGGRVWINLNDEVGRVKYSTALMAFASSKAVNIRANSAAPKMFGACELYDIVVLR